MVRCTTRDQRSETLPENQFFFEHVTLQDAVEAVNSARSNALGPDGIPLRHLKDCLSVILRPLINIFDTSVQSGIFPTKWKQALVRPLPKKKNATEVSDFRPISILSAASKWLEFVAYKQLSKFITRNDIFCSFQSGFRKGHSTHTALVNIVDDCRKAIDSECVTLLIGFDYTRAFDIVDIRLLVNKLRFLGLSDSVCNWFHSFLSGRSQSVVLPNGEVPAPLERTSGVPQGSILGPPCFSLFIIDLPSVHNHSKYGLYADDFVIYLSGHITEIETIIAKINEDIVSISQWAIANGLIINEKKTQAIWIGSKGFMIQLRRLKTSPIILNGNIITPCESLKVLGITLDSTLSWREQCNVTSKKSFAALARLRNNQGMLPASVKLTLVKSLVFPCFDYCAGLFLDLSKELRLKMRRCKNAAVRFATGTKIFEHITPDYEAKNIMEFETRRNYLAICLLASILRSKEPRYLSDRFSFRSCDRLGSKRISTLDLTVPKFETDCLRYSFYIGATYLWNALPRDIRASFMRPCFKKLLFNHFARQPACT